LRAGNNIRLRLLAWLVPALLTLIAISASVAYFVALHVATLAYDRALLDPALAMGLHLSWKDGHVEFDLPPVAQQVLLIDSNDELYFRITGPRGELVAGDADLPAPPAGLSKARFYDSTFRGQRMRVAALPMRLTPTGGAPAVVQIAETVRKRDQLIREVLLADLLPSILIAVATIVLIWFGVARGLAPLNRLRQEIAARSHRDLRPVPEHLSPEETRPLIDAINDMLGRLREAIGIQQRFIANAAHQLRTPLAAMLTQVELLSRAPLPEGQRGEVIQLRRAIGKAAHLANQLLTLARAEPADPNRASMKPVDLHEVCEELVQEWVPRAHARNIDLGFEIEEVTVAGDALLLRELIRNLLDNAVKYTADGGAVTLHVTGGNPAVIEVEDDGIGIPESERSRVVERFHRIDGTPGEGSGLGLAIVSEIAAAHGAELQITTPVSGRGTRVVVWFPRQASSTASPPCAP
jgi:two-component system sensor histidine kinase TctE